MVVMIVEELLRKNYNEYIERIQNKKPNEIFARELVQCKQKAIWKKQLQFIFTADTYFIINSLIHRAMFDFLAERYQAKTDIYVSKRIDNLIISDYIDAIDDNYVYEIKFVEGIGDSPLFHHRRHMKILLWLTEMERGKIIYISDDRMVEFDVEEAYDDAMVEDLLRTWESPLHDWECAYCHFSDFCSFSKL